MPLLATKKNTRTRSSPADRWALLRTAVYRGTFNSFTKEYSVVYASYSRRRKYKTMEDLLNDNDNDEPGNKFSKLVATKVLKTRAERKSMDVTSVANSEATSENDIKNVEAYESCIAAILHPLTQQMFGLQSETEEQNVLTAFVSSLTKHLPFPFSKQNDSDDACGKLSPTVFRELKKSVKDMIADKQAKDQDGIYYDAVCQFYQDVFKSRGHLFDQIGLTMDDLVHVFAKIVQDILDDHKSDPSKKDVVHYVNKMASLIRSVITKTCSTGRADELNQRLNKICTGKLNVPETNLSGKIVPATETNLKRTPSKSKAAQKIQKPLDALLEFVRLAFNISEPFHLKTIDRIKSSESDLVTDLRARIKSLDTQSDSLSHIYTTALSSFTQNPSETFDCWRFIELSSLSSLLSAYESRSTTSSPFSLPSPFAATTTAATVTTSRSSLLSPFGAEKEKIPISLRIRIISARDLLGKDQNGTSSDPYCTVSYGSSERYETDVVWRDLNPRWNQEVVVKVKPWRKKEIDVSVWDKDHPSELGEEKKGVSGQVKKLLSDEEDDFLGRVKVDVTEMMSELLKAPNFRVEKWYPLQKRSRRSHVAGDIKLDFSLVDPNEIAESSLAVTSTGSLADQLKAVEEYEPKRPKSFANWHHVFQFVLQKTYEMDCKQQSPYPSLATEYMLTELASRWRVSEPWRQLCLFEVLVDKYDKETIDIGNLAKLLEAQYRRFDQTLIEWNVLSNKIEQVRNKSTDPEDITKESGLTILTKDDLQLYESLTGRLIKLLETRLQHYKDYFPLDTPKGALVATLSLFVTLVENKTTSGKLKSDVHDSGVSIHDDTVPVATTIISPSAEELTRLIQAGTVERFHRLYEMASPMEEKPVRRLIQLADLIMEELDNDISYFRAPFASDINLVSITAEVYFKHLILEVEDILIVHSAIPHEEKVKKMDTSTKSALFELFYRFRDLKDRYATLIDVEEGKHSVASEFALHRWFAPRFCEWIAASDTKLLEWIDSAILVDAFHPIDEKSGVIHSTSVVDLFCCFHQILDCIQRLNWVESGGYSCCQSTEEIRKETAMREYQWSKIVTKFAKLVMRGISKYCESLQEQVYRVHQTLPQTRSLGDLRKSKESDDFIKKACQSAELLFNPFEEKNDLSEVLPPPNHTESRVPIETCVRLNNLETARQQLNDLYDAIDVDRITKIVEEYQSNQPQKPTPPKAEGLVANTISGYYTVRVVQAENLIACDKTGTSDPYCVLNLSYLKRCQKRDGLFEYKKDIRKIGQTKIVNETLHPRWDNLFSCFIPCGVELKMTIFDYDVIGTDDVCGEACLRFDSVKSIDDGDVHEAWVPVKPQGRILVRIQLESKAGSEVNDDGDAGCDFYFRKALRELKRVSGDMCGVVGDDIVRSPDSLVKMELVRILKNLGSHDSDSIWDSLFQKDSKKNVKNLITDEYVDKELTFITDYLNESLATISQNLYERFSKDLLRRTWKATLSTLEECMMPSSLYGEIINIPLLNRTKPLLPQQVQMTHAILEVLKSFFHAGGEGVSMDVLENQKYFELKKACQWYWSETNQLLAECEKCIKSSAAKATKRKGSDANADSDLMAKQEDVGIDVLMKIVRLRSPKDKACKKYFQEYMMKRDAINS